MQNITHKEVKELLDYNPETGILTWKNNRRKVSAGMPAGTINLPQGYLKTIINYKQEYNHRLIWLLNYGYLPEHDIDHINRNRQDNRIKNLRAVSHACNMRNRGNPKNNTSGVKGVYFSKSNNKWVARIAHDRRVYCLGNYKLKDNAICARLAGEQCLDWMGCNATSPAYKYVKKHIQSPPDKE